MNSSSEAEVIQLKDGAYRDVADYVLYIPRSLPRGKRGRHWTLDDQAKLEGQKQIAARTDASRENVNRLDVSVRIGRDWHGRGLACLCYGGRYWSLALRADRDSTKTGRVFQPRKRRIGASVATPFRASSSCWPSTEHLFSIEALSNCLGPLILRQESQIQGLVVISGATGSGKSQVARALLHNYVSQYLDSPAGSGRMTPTRLRTAPRPHLITIEKPIESHFLDDKRGSLRTNPLGQQDYGIDFTPRLLGLDTDSLEEALEDALRQKPCAVFVGELREAADWKAVLRFAGSGHFIVTTAHAGSLVEAMAWIMNSAGAQTPAHRGEIAERIRGLVHIRRETITPSHSAATPLKGWRMRKRRNGPIGALVPALWRNTPRGLSSLVSDYLSSLMPFYPKDRETPGESCLGRRWFTRSLLDRVKPFDEDVHVTEADGRSIALRERLMRLSYEADLQGI